MKGFMFLFIICFHHHLNDASDILNRQKRVIGGYYSPEGMFPYAVSLRVNKYGYFMHFCGGAIITEKYILSSAHCMIFQDETEKECYKGRYVRYDKMKYKTIAVVGTNELNGDSGISHEIHSFIFHDEFSYKIGVNDISLILTKVDIKFNKYTQPIKMHTRKVPAESAVVVPGWGLTSFPGDPSNLLKYIELSVISQAECEEAWATIFESQICTYRGEGEGVCTSDSGGPLVYKDELIGLVSYGKPCAVGYPDVFTNVSYMVPWIRKNMKCMDGKDINHKDDEEGFEGFWKVIQ